MGSKRLIGKLISLVFYATEKRQTKELKETIGPATKRPNFINSFALVIKISHQQNCSSNLFGKVTAPIHAQDSHEQCVFFSKYSFQLSGTTFQKLLMYASLKQARLFFNDRPSNFFNSLFCVFRWHKR